MTTLIHNLGTPTHSINTGSDSLNRECESFTDSGLLNRDSSLNARSPNSAPRRLARVARAAAAARALVISGQRAGPGLARIPPIADGSIPRYVAIVRAALDLATLACGQLGTKDVDLGAQRQSTCFSNNHERHLRAAATCGQNAKSDQLSPSTS